MQTLLFEVDKSEYWFTKENCNYSLVDTEETAQELSDILSNADIICFDVETTGLNHNNGKLVGFAVSCVEGEAYYVPISHNYGHNLDIGLYNKYIKPHLESKSVLGHNLKFDFKFAKHYLNTRINAKQDTFIISKLLDCFDFHGLKPLSELLFGFTVLDLSNVMQQYTIEASALDLLIPSEVFEYCCQDVDLTLRLYNHFVEKFNWKRSFIYEEEIKLIESLARIESRGVLIDRDFLINTKKQHEDEVENISATIRQELGAPSNLNIDSHIKVANAILQLYPGFKSKLLYTQKSKRVKMDEEAVEGYIIKFDAYCENTNQNHINIFELLLRRRKLVSIVSKYLSPWIDMIEERKSEVIYTNFNSLGTDTGRMSSNDPNLQNVSPKIRRAIVPRPGYYFISMDYDQVEFRIFAAMAGLDFLVKKINEEDVDVHKLAASIMYDIDYDSVPIEKRNTAKTLNFGVLYRMGAKALSRNLEISVDEADHLLSLYNDTFLHNTPWFDRVISFARKNGYVLTSYGRKRRIDNIDIQIPKYSSYQDSKELRYLYAAATRKAINTPVQGTAADIMKIATNNVFKLIDSEALDVHPVIIVHDDIVFEVSDKYDVDFIAPKLRGCLETMFKDKINLTVDCNISKESWGGLKD